MQYSNDGYLVTALTKLRVAEELVLDAQDKLSQVPCDNFEESLAKLEQIIKLLKEI